ncbi:TPA: response regulator [Candidatus Poribacteria bacterium]|nr:response regulator [Candidatus Poribacteria bacterium]
MKTVLFIEDDENICKLYEAELSDKYKVVVIRDGNKAMEILERESPDLIVLDIMLPGMDGVTLLERIKRWNKDLPVIVSTAYGAYRDSTTVWSADERIIKSSDLTELKRKIAQYLD